MFEDQCSILQQFSIKQKIIVLLNKMCIIEACTLYISGCHKNFKPMGCIQGT